MNLSSILTDLRTVVGLAKTAMELGADVAPFINLAVEVANGKELKAEERVSLAQQESGFRALIDSRVAQDDAATD